MHVAVDVYDWLPATPKERVTQPLFGKSDDADGTSVVGRLPPAVLGPHLECECVATVHVGVYMWLLLHRPLCIAPGCLCCSTLAFSVHRHSCRDVREQPAFEVQAGMISFWYLFPACVQPLLI